MKIQKNISLKPYNTFGIDVNAAEFITIDNLESLIDLIVKHNKKNIFLLGGGSNMLLTKDIDQLVIKFNTKGIDIIEQDQHNVLVEVQSGENWHEFVLWSIAMDFAGVENLSLIPGNVGTAPIQNIGAYGQEVKDTIVSCTALEIQTGKMRTFTNEQCNFGYRESIFKNQLKDQYIITSVTFKLTKDNHVLKTQYGAIQAKLDIAQIQNPTIKDISQAVIAIRQEKLPDPKHLGNSGSFFKNPIITRELFESLLKKHPDMPSYPVDQNTVKVPAGWLIEKCGFKGYRKNDAGVHENQALVLVNHGNATGQEIYELSKEIQAKIQHCFGIKIQVEVNIF